MIKEENLDFKNALTGIKIIFLYLIISSIPYHFLTLFNINYNNLSFITKQIYLIIYELILLFIIAFIYRKEVLDSFIDFKKNILKYLKKYLKYWLVTLLLMTISNMIISIFTSSYTAANQKVIEEELRLSPIYTFIVTVLIAPILEELVFRISFKKIFAHTKFLFIFFSGFFFGFMHVIGSLENLIDLLFIIPYSIPGFMFAYIYCKTDNICIPISLHIIHNLLIMIVQIALLFKI